MFSQSVLFICLFTFMIHMTESLAYSMRLAGVRTKQIAIAMSFVTSTLLISRLSNMFQAPLLGALVDKSTLDSSGLTLSLLESQFRFIIVAAFCGALVGAFLTPTFGTLYQAAIKRFLKVGSIPRVVGYALKPSSLVKIIKSFRLPPLSSFKKISLSSIPKGFLIINVVVTSIYTIGVLCSLLAGAYLPEFRATAIQLSGIVNGMATVMFTLFVDPSGARITDQAVHDKRPEDDVRSVVFFLQLGKLVGTLFIAQLLFKPLTKYIMMVTMIISKSVS
ncbi:DUF2837 domain-containing protein [Candidatus Marinamargulisbacteria bacterium SCGC AAA071-K20]|nr:DUF2837 domain-containing protein [Candidatus Marinamargulisbacteria bacterium SCGC AAA071-K20]